jgi:hypothetical protein
MIELTGDPQVDTGIIRFANRRRYWYEVVEGLEFLVQDIESRPAISVDELAMIEEVKSLIAKIN